MLIPQKSSGHLWRPTLMFDIRQRRILYQLSAPDSGNVTPACRWQMGGLGVWRWPHPLPLYGSARRNVLSPSPRPSFLLIILPHLFLSAQSHLTSPLSDLLAPLYPTLPTFPFFLTSTSYLQAQIWMCASRSSKYGNWQIARVWLGRISLYVSIKEPVSVHKDNFAVSITSTRDLTGECMDGYTGRVWIHLTPPNILRDLNKEKIKMFHFLSPMMPSLSSLDAVFILHDGKCVFSQIANTLPECVKHSRAQHMFGTIL